MLGQGGVDGLLHGAEDGPFLAEAHLGLGWMHVDVHQRRVQLDQQHGHRVAAHHQPVAVGLGDGIGQAAVLDRAAVEEEEDVVAVGAAEGRQARVSGHPNRLGLVGLGLACGAIHHADRDQLPARVQPPHLDQHVVQPAAAGGLEDQPAVGDQAEAPFGEGHGEALHHVGNVARLGGGLAQELQAGRHVVEQVLNGDHRAGRRAFGLLADQVAALNPQLAADIFSAVAGE